MKRALLILLLLINAINLFSNDKRLYQLISKKRNESFLCLEAGNYLGLSLVSKKMSLNLGYSYLINPGFSMTTELTLFKFSTYKDLVLSCGLGGGMLFTPETDNFESDMLVGLSTKVNYDNFYVKLTPMVGYSMFKRIASFEYALFLVAGYQFDLVREEIEK